MATLVCPNCDRTLPVQADEVLRSGALFKQCVCGARMVYSDHERDTGKIGSLQTTDTEVWRRIRNLEQKLRELTETHATGLVGIGAHIGELREKITTLDAALKAHTED